MEKQDVLKELLNLPLEDRRSVLHEAWESMRDAESDGFALTPELVKELDRRYADAKAHPERMIPLEELDAHLAAARARR